MIEQNKLNIIHCGDSLEILKTIPDESIHLILQDPPYNITSCDFEWDIFKKIDEFWKEWKRVIKPNGVIVMTGNQPFTSKLILSNLSMFRQELIWVKDNVTGFLDVNFKHMKRHENVLIFSKAKSKIKYNPQMTKGLTYDRTRGTGGGNSITKDKKITCGKNRTINNGTRYPTSVLEITTERTGLHPTQKPVALFEYLIRTYSDKGDCVFDGFAGSGTTAVACKKQGRDYICIELDRNYVDIANKRISSVNKPLFVL